MALFKLKLDFFVSSTRVYVDITAEREFAHSQSNFFFFSPSKAECSIFSRIERRFENHYVKLTTKIFFVLCLHIAFFNSVRTLITEVT